MLYPSQFGPLVESLCDQLCGVRALHPAPPRNCARMCHGTFSLQLPSVWPPAPSQLWRLGRLPWADWKRQPAYAVCRGHLQPLGLRPRSRWSGAPPAENPGGWGMAYCWWSLCSVMSSTWRRAVGSCLLMPLLTFVFSLARRVCSEVQGLAPGPPPPTSSSPSGFPCCFSVSLTRLPQQSSSLPACGRFSSTSFQGLLPWAVGVGRGPVGAGTTRWRLLGGQVVSSGMAEAQVLAIYWGSIRLLHHDASGLYLAPCPPPLLAGQ